MNHKQILSLPTIPVGENIRKWRELKCVKQRYLAKILGITPGALSNIENNKANLSTLRLQHIAFILKVDVTMLFSNPAELLSANEHRPQRSSRPRISSG